MKSLRPALLSAAVLSVGCTSPPDVPASRIVRQRVLGVRAEPAEVDPHDKVKWTALVASPDGFVEDADIEWAICVRPRGPSDPITVAPACRGVPEHLPPTPDGGTPPPPPLQDLKGHGLVVSEEIASNVCSLIGPEVPQKDPAGNPQRPPDADVTGGYQLPVRLKMHASTGPEESFVRQRIHCKLGFAPADIAREYAMRYQLNQNPALATVTVDGSDLSLDGATELDVATRRLKLVADWDDDQKESYVLFDPISRQIVERDEILDVAWFTDGGEFDDDRTVPSDGQSHSTNMLSVDSQRDVVHVWVLLRDDRGGLGYARFTLNVQ